MVGPLREVLGFWDGMIRLECGHKLAAKRKLSKSIRMRCPHCKEKP
jgi:hypothetical protein